MNVTDHGECIKPGRHRIIITGPLQSGKSSLIWALVEQLDDLSIPVGGFVAEGLWQNNRRAGFDLINLNTRIKTPLARRDADAPIVNRVADHFDREEHRAHGLSSIYSAIELEKNDGNIGLNRRVSTPEHPKIPYTFFEKGMAVGMAAIQPDACRHAKVIVVDEVGKLEMKGHGWASALPQLMALKDPVHIWIVRDVLVDGVCGRWPFDRDDIIGVDDSHPLEKLLKRCLKRV